MNNIISSIKLNKAELLTLVALMTIRLAKGNVTFEYLYILSLGTRRMHYHQITHTQSSLQH